MKAAGNDLSLITDQGPGPDKSGPLFELREMAFDHALLWSLTNDAGAAIESKAILMRFAEVMRHWPIYDRHRKAHPQETPSLLRNWKASGLWGIWHPLDLAASLPLLRAYDIIRPTLSEKERETIETDLFVYHKAFIDRCTGLASGYGNLSGYHLIPLIRFGQVLERPDFIHHVVRYWRNQLAYSYSPDGFFKEVTTSYHTQITSRLSQTIPALLKGYSDPAGYRDPETDERLEDLDLRAEFAERLGVIDNALNALLLPDGNHAHLNDSWPRRNYEPNNPAKDQPSLLGISGVAKLSSRQMAAVIKFGGIRGHDHRDALNVIWHAGGREVFSDTGYQPEPKLGIEFERAWGASTASHQTVAINKQLHHTDRSLVTVPSPKTGSAFSSEPPAQPGKHPVEATLPIAARFLNQGRLLLWDARHSEAQAMEAEQPGAYPGTASLFRRTVVMLPASEGEGILIEIFRVKGGTTHDYFLRGDLGSPYTMAFDQPLQPASGDHYTYIKLEQAGPIRPPLKATARYEDGLEIDSHLASTKMSEDAQMSLLVGSAPAIRRPGTATFTTLRHTAASDPLKTDFIWVHEAHRGSARIQSVKAERIGGGICIKVEQAGRSDYLFSGDNDESQFDFENWKFTGRLAHASTVAGKASGIVFSGSDLRQNETVAKGKSHVEGKLLSTNRREAGDATNSLLIEIDQESTLPKLPDGPQSLHLAHIDFNDSVRFSIPIKSVTPESGNRVRVELAHSPGFEQQPGYTAMTNYPGWRISGQARVRLE